MIYLMMLVYEIIVIISCLSCKEIMNKLKRICVMEKSNDKDGKEL